MACDESLVLGMSTHLQLEVVVEVEGVEGRLRGHHMSLPDPSHLGVVEVEVVRLQVRLAAGG